MLPSEMWSDGVALVTGMIACGIDLKWRKIPNWLTWTAFGIGLCGHAVLGFWGGLGAAGGGLTGLALLIIPFLSGGMGGGDVKLLMALGTLLGAVRILWVFIYAGIAGGFVVLVYLVYRLGMPGAYFRLRLMLAAALGGREKQVNFVKLAGAQPLQIPYGVAIFFGLAWEIILNFDRIHALWG